MKPADTISVVNQPIQFREGKESLRVMLAQISPAYDPEILKETGLVKTLDPERQAERIVKIMEYAICEGADLLFFPELTAPFAHRESLEQMVKDCGRDLVVSFCYEHTLLRDLLSVLSSEEHALHRFSSSETDTRIANFARVVIRAGEESKVFTQVKLTPFSGEFSLSSKESFVCGNIVHRFVTNWGNFLFLICKDYVGEVRTEKKIPMFDFLKSLTSEGLHYVFVSALNTEPEAFIHAARAFYYMQEKSIDTFSLFLNTAELNHTTVVFPVRPHPKIRTTEEIEIIPLFAGKPGWGTQFKFPGAQERIIAATFVHLDRYRPMPTKEIFSPIYQTDIADLSQLGIASEVIVSEKPSPKKAPPTPVHNLPPQTTPFLGRTEEITEIGGLLEQPSCRLLTLVGPGGIGKTRLALKAASERLTYFSHGVYFVPLAPLSSPDFLVSTVAESLKFSFQSREDLKVQLLNYLREKEMLLVMDNFEHLIEGVELVTDILKNAPGVKIVVTSRERLNLTGEWVVEIQGMKFPQDGKTDGVEHYSAVQLFVQGAQRVRPDFTLTEEEKPHVARICQLVQGMPLAIELASAWMRMLSCSEVITEIERNLDFLSTSLRDVPERHRSLRAVFEYSWNLLTEDERKIFIKMSVFRGGFRREAADRVTGSSICHLVALVDKSFLHWGAHERYEMHEVLRQYGEEKLGAIPEESEAVKILHSEYYADFLHQREASVRDRKKAEALNQIGEEIENVRAAWTWAVEHASADVLEKSVESLFQFHILRGWFQEGEDLFGKAVAKLEEMRGGTEGQYSHPVSLRGRVLARQGSFCYRLGSYGKAKELLARSVDVLNTLDDVKGETAFSLSNLGYVSYLLGEHEEAGRQLEESLVLYREIEDEFGIAKSLNNIGNVACELGHFTRATELYDEGLSIFRKIDDQWGMSRAFNNLGNVYHRLGKYDEARALHERSLAICRETGDKQGMARSLINLGTLANRLGQYEEAEKLQQECLAICREIGDRKGIAVSLNNLGNAIRHMRAYEEARRLYRESLAIKREIGDRKGIAYSLNNLGSVAYELQEYEEAKQLYSESLSLFKELANPQGQAYSLTELGRTALALGDLPGSHSLLIDALGTAMKVAAAPLTLEILVGIGAVSVETGQKEEALELLLLAFKNPAGHRETKNRAEALISRLREELPPEAVQRAEEKARTGNLQERMEEILSSER